MNPAAVFALAIGLSLDSFAASLGKGAAAGRLPARHVVFIAALFGTCEAAALTAGWAAGQAFATLITSVDHWIAFGLLLAVGARMIQQSASLPGERRPPIALVPLRMLAIAAATSVDSVVVGISLAFIDADIFQAILIVGLVTFVVTMGGAGIGRSAAPVLGRRAELLGGLTMICVGSVILARHLYG